VRSRFKLILLMPLIGLAACASTNPSNSVAPDVATAPAQPFTLERFRDERKLSDSVLRVVLDNPYGDIQLRQTTGSVVAIQGVEQRIGEAPRIANIEWQEDFCETAVRVRYPGIDPDEPADRRKGRVDLYAFVPVGMPVSLRSDFGEIVVRRIDNPVTARSRSGRITVASHGRLDIESETGELRVYPMSARSTGTHRLRSAANIVLDVHLQPPLRLVARAARGVRANFEFDALSQDTSGLWQADLSLTDPTLKGERLFDIASGTGEVLLQGVNADTAP